jgi:DNA-binding XRE family transcriptional regulator
MSAQRKTARLWKQTRKAMLLSQTEFCAALGLHERTVQGIERGEHPPSWVSQRRFRDFVRRYKLTECKKNRELKAKLARDAGPEWN